MNRLTVTAGFLLIPLLAGCTTLTPVQSAGLKEAQQFADTVTGAYGVGRVRLIARPEDTVGAHWPRSDWITVGYDELAKEDRFVRVCALLAWATLALPPHERWPTADQEQRTRYAVNRRGVEIMVKFLGMTTWEAIDRYAAVFVAQSKVYARDRAAWRSYPSPAVYRFFLVHPCDQIHDLWSHFAITEPAPECPVSATGR